ncbi:MAG: heme exporter protein CcmD [Sulfitobacter sp.]
MPDLGKYAIEVLSAYGVSLLLIAGLLVMSVRRGSKARAQLRRLEEETVRHAKD